MTISPIIGYYGSKRRLLEKGLLDTFPSDINTFYDVFAGSASVSLNVKAKGYVVNDSNFYVYNLYNMFKESQADVIIKHIQNNIKDFDLNVDNCNYDNIHRQKYNENFLKLRNWANKTKNVLDFYTLVFHSFNYLYRFNSKGEFNAPFGQRFFREEHKKFIQDGCNFFSQGNVKIQNKDFRCIDISKMVSNDFVYLDPPYFNCKANYNENNGWTSEDENALHEFCDQLNKNNIKFALSNVAINKGEENTQLLSWIKEKSYNIIDFSDCINYTACSNEILVTNY